MEILKVDILNDTKPVYFILKYKLMKKYLIALAFFISTGVCAQKIALSKGQEITITTNGTQDIDMSGMGMQMKNITSSTSLLKVMESNKENITTSYTLTKVNLSMDMMGQQSSYDSEKPEDKDSEMGKAISEKIDKAINVIINKNTGKAILKKPERDSTEKKEDANPLEGLMDSFGSVTEEATVETVFFNIPNEKKAGESWIDSSSNNKMKEIKTYTLKSIVAGIANVGFFSTMDGSNSMETQGMQMDINLSAKTEGEIIVDTKSSLVKKRSSVMDMTGSIDVMGQSVPITSKAIVNIDYK